MTGYTRQSTAEIDAGEDINAEPLADEFNALADAFNGVTGHSHDGSSGSAPKINLTTSVSGQLPTANIADVAVVTAKIAERNVTNAKLADVATGTIKGRVATGSGIVSDLTAADVQGLLSVDHLIALSGVSEGSNGLGAFDGALIPDHRTVKQALQVLETAVENGAADGSVTNARLADMATATIKGRIAAGTGDPQDLTATQAREVLGVDHLITLSGVAGSSNDLGTFTGSTISDSQTIKQALQALETKIESSDVIKAVSVYTSSGTHNFAAGTTYAIIEVWGAGGGGRATGTGTPRSGPGGGSGGYVFKVITTIPSSATITIGAGGGSSSSGGNSSYSDGTVTLTAGGGGSGVAVASTSGGLGGTGGTATGGDINIVGGVGEPTFASGLTKGGTGGLPPKGVGSPGWSWAENAGGGVDFFMSATGYCAGGGGANNNGDATARSGGSGAPGLVIIKEFGL